MYNHIYTMIKRAPLATTSLNDMDEGTGRELEMQQLFDGGAASKNARFRASTDPRRCHRLRNYVRIKINNRAWFGIAVGAVNALVLAYILVGGKGKKMDRPVLETRLKSGDKFSSFRILQITDLHIGEAEDTARGPEQDQKSLKALDRLVSLAHPIDFIVLSGDQLSANQMYHNNVTKYQYQLSKQMESYQIPWSLIFGNHDDAPSSSTTLTNTTTKRARERLVEIDQLFSHSLTQIGPNNVNGVSNYVLNVKRNTGGAGGNFQQDDIKAGEEDVALQLLFLDTGGGSTDKALATSQKTWWNQVRSPSIPGVVIQHIPTTEFASRFQADTCVGDNSDGGVDAIRTDFDYIDSLDDQVALILVGHMHGNDYCCPYSTSLSLCCGRHAGYGGYEGLAERGARVYEFIFDTEDINKLSWRSYVQLEKGGTQSEYSKSMNFQ